ncbi:uncharacterized protein [Ptychodera flava]|uniref:uncharacterized protein n=1 Tax=Ptychodera flava TaxID=63121 RepID=UPI00396A6511
MATIHRLTSNLAAETGRRVNAIVIEANGEDKEDAESKGVHLMLPDDTDPEEKPTLAWLTKYHSIHYPSLKKMSDVNVVIGHATTTSKAALDIQREYFRGKKVILFNHVLPEDTEVTRDDFTPTRVQQREATLCQEVSRCRVVFSVGPRVYHHFENKFSTLPSVKHELFLPLPAETFFQIGMKKPSITCQKQILTYGRIGHVNHLVGYDVVARGLSKYVTDLKKRKPTFNSPVWLISGIQEEGVRSASDFIKKHVTSGDLHLKVTFNWSNSQIINDLQESHLCLIPSHVEPFGMFGLEAIAAGIPVLVNSNSGLAMFLTKYMHPDKAAAVILDVGVTDTKRKRDINRWANRIAEVFEDYDHAFERAQEMKKMLRDCHAIKETHTVFKRECCVKEN